MTKVTRPPFIYHHLTRKFSWEGFCKLDIHEALQEPGFSNSEIGRLFKAGSIKIRDTRITETHYEWYRRIANPDELIEPDDVLYIGKKVLIIHQQPFSLMETLYYRIRDRVDILRDRIEDRCPARKLT